MKYENPKVAKLIVKCCFVFIAIMLIGCKKEDKSILLTVFDTPNYSIQFDENPDEITFTPFMVIKEEDSSEKHDLNMYAIKNFAYEKGYEYLLKVKKISNNDYHYSLLETISKTLTGEIDPIILINVTSKLIEGEVPYESLIIREENEDFPLWYRYSFKIVGFDYEKGFDYQLKVKKTVIQRPPQTGSRYFHIYTLIEIISKTPKNQ